MSAKENQERFSEHIFEPECVSVEGGTYRLYRARFTSLYGLYEYLKSEPEINYDVFSTLSSLKGSKRFAGKPYQEAVEDLINEVDPGYEEFLQMQQNLNRVRKGKVHQFKLVRTVAGGHLNIPAYSAGNPLCYETEERISKPKFVGIHVTLSYCWDTTKKQVLHRAIIITNIIKALEKAGYSVDLNTFELSYVANELIYIIVQIKRHGGRLDMNALYKTLCHVEFLRRILFRILETLDVQNDWGSGYGRTCSENFARKLLHLGKNDLFFDQPNEMEIYGEDLAEDFENAIRHLHLEDKIDVEKSKKEFKEQAMKLTKKNR